MNGKQVVQAKIQEGKTFTEIVEEQKQKQLQQLREVEILLSSARKKMQDASGIMEEIAKSL